MIHSMTAFARVDVALDSSVATPPRTGAAGGSLQWEIRSVNHRYLEPQFRLPDALRDLEFPLRDLLRARLRRGKIDCTLRLAATAAPLRLDINRPALLHLLATIEQLRRDEPDASHVDPLDLLRWPGVLIEPSHDEEGVKNAALGAFERALDALEAHRRREGAALAELIVAKLGEIERIVAELRQTVASVSTTQRARLRARIEELGATVDPDRLEQEIVLLVQRADVTEELDRLDVHVVQARKSIAGRGPHGRHLDFLSQELNREANTIASKSILAESTQRAIDLKVLIEQIREQVQNIE